MVVYSKSCSKKSVAKLPESGRKFAVGARGRVTEITKWNAFDH
jgi:hypothetical protein